MGELREVESVLLSMLDGRPPLLLERMVGGRPSSCLLLLLLFEDSFVSSRKMESTQPLRLTSPACKATTWMENMLLEASKSSYDFMIVDWPITTRLEEGEEEGEEEGMVEAAGGGASWWKERLYHWPKRGSGLRNNLKCKGCPATIFLVEGWAETSRQDKGEGRGDEGDVLLGLVFLSARDDREEVEETSIIEWSG